ncbi:hypothetical protein AN958_06171 [Leucoagaricus sp. SymC.cos]|nr:hypothetical protein AN958_06171 [Leucoagaricus sp. SymC.cos]
MPPVVQVPAPLFRKVYIDPMHMPPSYGTGFEEIVTDNGTAFVAALDWIADWYHIRRIKISVYNSQFNGVVETTHRTIHDGLVKMCAGGIKNGYEYAPYIFWADRVTTRKSTGMTPYNAVHGVEPLHPFDITEATFLASSILKVSYQKTIRGRPWKHERTNR